MNLSSAPRWLTGLKRLAAFSLACSFFLPLYSCSTRSQPPGATSAVATASAPAPASGAVHAAPAAALPTPPKLPAQMEFTAYEAFSWGDPYSMASLAVFFWPVVMQLVLVVVPAAAGARTAAPELLLCLGSVTALAWLLWRAHYMPGYQAEYGLPMAALALAVYAGATAVAARSSRTDAKAAPP
jgi:hypothetical protein